MGLKEEGGRKGRKETRGHGRRERGREFKSGGEQEGTVGEGKRRREARTGGIDMEE